MKFNGQYKRVGLGKGGVEGKVGWEWRLERVGGKRGGSRLGGGKSRLGKQARKEPGVNDKGWAGSG